MLPSLGAPCRPRPLTFPPGHRLSIVPLHQRPPVGLDGPMIGVCSPALCSRSSAPTQTHHDLFVALEQSLSWSASCQNAPLSQLCSTRACGCLILPRFSAVVLLAQHHAMPLGSGCRRQSLREPGQAHHRQNLAMWCRPHPFDLRPRARAWALGSLLYPTTLLPTRPPALIGRIHFNAAANSSNFALQNQLWTATAFIGAADV
ncbi:uncharacterized protein IWZ02DRAFT_94225 [Phyllosticta citriasiana]|uniref:uncharacterized protein n=1 Tax=Phyllosticta citriasiana TaxID=595635 RepID=UPI0030FD30D5